MGKITKGENGRIGDGWMDGLVSIVWTRSIASVKEFPCR